MDLIPSLEAARGRQDLRGLALGFFDGVHIGHQRVFEHAAGTDGAWGILTFWPHPRTVLHPGSPLPLITGLPHKLELFRQAGAHLVILQPFDAEFASTSAHHFLERLFSCLSGLRSVGCGPNFHFGKGREGTPSLLRQMAEARGIRCSQPPLELVDGSAVSSSRLRTALTEGDLAQAARMLGRPYRLTGRVVRGRQLGRQLGFPTANLASEDSPLLPEGVYAGHALVPGAGRYAAAINLGAKPTIDPDAPYSIEAHLLGFSGCLDMVDLQIEPMQFLRPQQRFPSRDDLVKAIRADVSAVASLRGPSPVHP